MSGPSSTPPPIVTLGVAKSKFLQGLPLSDGEKSAIATELGIIQPKAIDSIPENESDPRGSIFAFFDDTYDSGFLYLKVGLHKWVVFSAQAQFPIN